MSELYNLLWCCVGLYSFYSYRNDTSTYVFSYFCLLWNLDIVFQWWERAECIIYNYVFVTYLRIMLIFVIILFIHIIISIFFNQKIYIILSLHIIIGIFFNFWYFLRNKSFDHLQLVEFDHLQFIKFNIFIN